MIVRVECDAEGPVAIHIGDRRIGVAERLDRWPGEGYRYVKLRGQDGATYILRHDEGRDIWELTLYERS